MKKMIFSLAASLVCLFSAGGQPMDRLWKEYEKTEKSDRPKDGLKILETIQLEARRQRSDWDYYKATNSIYSLSVSLDWRRHEEYDARMNSDLKSYGSPVISMYRLRYGNAAELENFISSHADALKASRNRDFYTDPAAFGSAMYGNVLPELIRNDYEFGLWLLLFADNARTDGLKACYGDEYPYNALYEFPAADRYDEGSRNRLEAYALKYSGKAAELLAQQELAFIDMTDLQENEKGSSGQYRALRARCVKIAEARTGFAGTEAGIAQSCVKVDDLVEQLDAPRAEVSIDNGVLEMKSRNVASAHFVFKDDSGAKVLERTLVNGLNSYYRQDTSRFLIPTLNDGDYEVGMKASGLERSLSYRKYTLSHYVRRDIRGNAIYVTDYLSGEPVQAVDLVIREGKSQRTFSGLELKEGFAYLPEEFDARQKNSSVKALFRDASGVLRSSDFSAISEKISLSEGKEDMNVQIMTDRAAYNPGETIRIGVLAYTRGKDLSLCPAGKELTLKLRDSKSETVAERRLVTDSWGCASCEIGLDDVKNPGFMHLSVYADGESIARSVSIRVDEFVLPTYTVEWEGGTSLKPDGDGKLHFRGRVISFAGRPLDDADIEYALDGNGKRIAGGKLALDISGRFDVAFSEEAANDYWRGYQLALTLVDQTGETQGFSRWGYCGVIREPQSEMSFHSKTDIDVTGQVGMHLNTCEKPVYALVELLGDGYRPLVRRVERIEGGNPGSADIVFNHAAEYPDRLLVRVIYFIGGEAHLFKTFRHRSPSRYSLPLEFTRFSDRTGPSEKTAFILHSDKDVHAVASVFDLSSETIMPNVWERLDPFLHIEMRDFPRESFMAGCNSGHLLAIKMRGTAAKFAYVNNVAESDALGAASFEDSAVPVRSEFSGTIAWYPDLLSDEGGDIAFDVTASGRLSTYCVQVFAHDRRMRNAVMRRELLVTVPVQLSIRAPRYLYDSDVYVLRVSLSNSGEDAVEGDLCVEGCRTRLAVPAHSTVTHSVRLDVSGLAGREKTVLATFDAGKASASDAIRISIPVRDPRQTLVEAHSAVLPYGADKAAVEADLRAAFVNCPGSGAVAREISIREMLHKALPAKLEARGDNVVDLMNALFSDILLKRMGREGLSDADRAKTEAKLSACRREDGGYAWMSGLSSSRIMTAWLLAAAYRAGYALPDVEGTLRYLDLSVLGTKEAQPRLFPLDFESYAFVRSLYGEVPFDTGGLDAKTLRTFRKEIKNALVPTKDRGRQGDTYGKIRRVLTLRALCESPALASAWGLGGIARLEKSASADMESLRQYMQPHHSGGCNCPVAFTGRMGLLSGDLFAHVQLCEIFEGEEYADGIRLWMMLQKETQQWKNDPAYIEALACVLKAPESILETRVLALEASVALEFGDIRSAGNGFTIRRSWLLDGRLLAEGDTLRVGERVTLKVDFSSEDMRSFALLIVPRPANLRAVQQNSGYEWGAYHSVKADCDEYWFETCPQERSISSDFFVEAEGVFHSAAATIECLYAPHYRANESAPATLTSR